MEPKSLIQIINNEEFLTLLREPSAPFFKICNSFTVRVEGQKDVSKKFYANFIQDTEFLESFLDEHGARENKDWAPFTEFIASIRNLVISAFYIKHLLDRYPYYNLLEAEDIQENFTSLAKGTLTFLNKSILNIYQEVVGTAKTNGLDVPTEFSLPNEFSEVETNLRLPRNIMEEEVKNEDERVIDLCEKIRKVWGMMKESQIPRTDDPEELKRIIPGKIDEKVARMYKNLIHSVQSDFDTYVKNTKMEKEHEAIRNLRGYISMPLHLLEVVLWLCHFYERHEDEIRHGESKKKISLMVNKAELLSRIVNFAFYHSMHFIQEASRLAGEILKNCVRLFRAEVPIPKPLGFHARPCTYITLIARHHEGELNMIVDGGIYSAKSVMSLLQAGGMVADNGYQTVIFEGGKRAVEDIKILARHNYCEEQEIPRELGYLRVLRNTA